MVMKQKECKVVLRVRFVINETGVYNTDGIYRLGFDLYSPDCIIFTHKSSSCPNFFPPLAFPIVHRNCK